MKPQRKAYLFAITAILCWSTVGSAIKISLRYTDFVNLLLWSSLVACLFLLAVILLKGSWLQLIRATRKEILISALLGLLNPFLYYLILLRAYELLPAQEAATLNYIWPVILVLLAIPLLRQKIRMRSILAILVSFSGIIVISTQGNLKTLHFSNTTGVALAVGSAFFWALYWIINLKDERNTVLKLFTNFCFGFAYILLFSLITGMFRFPGPEALLGACYIGLFEMGLTFVLWLNALRYSTTTARVSNLIYLSPFISLIFIQSVVGETILMSTIAGLILIVGGIILQQLRQH